MSIIIQAKDISHSYDYPLFTNINLTLNSQESTSIIGVSGSGKSTILYILSSLLKPKRGEVLINDTNIYKLKQNEILKIRRYDIGIIFQSHYLFKGFSAKENIEIANILARKEFDEQIMRALKINEILEQNVSNISGGQQQRVSIARVLSKKPKIIFADEPTGNLDKQTALEVMNVIFDYIRQNNASLFMVTHDEELAKRCTHTYKLINQTLELWN